MSVGVEGLTIRYDEESRDGTYICGFWMPSSWRDQLSPQYQNLKGFVIRWEYMLWPLSWHHGATNTVERNRPRLNAESWIYYYENAYKPPKTALAIRCYVVPDCNVDAKIKCNYVYGTFLSATWPDWVGSPEVYIVETNQPAKPSVPTVTLRSDGVTADIKVNGYQPDTPIYNQYAAALEFQIMNLARPNNPYSVYGYSIKKQTDYLEPLDMAAVTTLAQDNKYKVRSRAWIVNSSNPNVKYNCSEWTEWTNKILTKPSAPTMIYVEAKSETAILVSLVPIGRKDSSQPPADLSIVIEYTKEKDYFENNAQGVSSVTIKDKWYTELTGLEAGNKWYIRAKYTNSGGESGYSPIITAITGKIPSEPTTWSLTTTAHAGEDLALYWTHNSEDASTQSMAQVSMTVDGQTNIVTVETPERKEDKVYNYIIPAGTYQEGATVKWKVRTRGVLVTGGTGNDGYSDWSIERTINIYAQPTSRLYLENGDTVRAYPLNFVAEITPRTQQPIGYSLTITANEDYTIVGNDGTDQIISKGTTVYNRYENINHITVADPGYLLKVSLYPADLRLGNNASYTANIEVSMNVGLVASSSMTFTTKIPSSEVVPQSRMGYDPSTYSVRLIPYATNAAGDQLAENRVLSVYRMEYNGEFTLIQDGVENNASTVVTDMHPSLSRAKYRIVAIDTETGDVDFGDMAPYPIDESSIIIQWNGKAQTIDAEGMENLTQDSIAQPIFSGITLKLPYNINIQESNTKDVSFVQYIGRKRPVSYYGTQLGEKSTWSCSISKKDEETLQKLRELAIWTDNVYVREPSGMGYNASVEVSFSKSYNETTIPVTINITRVEGGP